MDYDFYARRIADVPPDLLAEALAYASSLELDINKSYFNPRHPGFNSITHKLVDANYSTSGPGARYVPIRPEELHPVVKRLTSLVSHIFEPSALTSYEVNRLEPFGEILEHTDQTPTDT